MLKDAETGDYNGSPFLPDDSGDPIYFLKSFMSRGGGLTDTVLHFHLRESQVHHELILPM